MIKSEKKFYFVVWQEIDSRHNAMQSAVKTYEIRNENHDNQHNLYVWDRAIVDDMRHREVSIEKKDPSSRFAKIFARLEQKLTLSRSAKRGARHWARQR